MLVFRDQQLTRDSHEALARRFGRLHVHPMHHGGHRGADPETGRTVLYLNGGFTSHIESLSRPESRVLLDLLFRHIDSTPRLYCRVEWRPNTLSFWDKRCTQHHAVWDCRFTRATASASR